MRFILRILEAAHRWPRVAAAPCRAAGRVVAPAEGGGFRSETPLRWNVQYVLVRAGIPASPVRGDGPIPNRPLRWRGEPGLPVGSGRRVLARVAGGCGVRPRWPRT